MADLLTVDDRDGADADPVGIGEAPHASDNHQSDGTKTAGQPASDRKLTPVSYAIAYARRGMRVLPCHEIEGDGECSCGKLKCGSAGKHPREVGWQESATTDEDQIREWWRQWPTANIGIATGKGSNLTVLDVDGDEGRETLRALELEHGELPETPIAISGSDGDHYYLLFEEGLPNAVKFAPGLDIRTEGGLVIGVGSRNKKGAYRWEIAFPLSDTLKPARMPRWLVDLIRNAGASPDGQRPKVPSNAHEFVEGSGRNDAIWKLGRSLKAQDFPASAIEAALLKTNEEFKEPFSQREIARQIAHIIKHSDRPGFEAAAQQATDGAAADADAHEAGAADRASGRDDLPAALSRIAEIDKQIKNDLTLAYSPDYLSAAATVSERDAQTFERLKKNLKARGVSISNWESRVKEVVRKRAAETKAAIENATATNAAATVTTIAPPAPEPWDRPVTGLTLLNDLRDFLAKFIVVTPDVLIAITLWIVFTYLLDIAEYSPRLAITSATPRCGKTTVLDLLGELMLKPIAASNVTAAAIFRIIEQEKCGLLIDEYDTMKAGSEKFEEIRGITNSGHTRASAFVLRAVKYRDDFIVKKFSTWAAMAVAAIGRLPDTLADRSIAIPLRRKSPKQKVERLIQRNKWAHQTAADLARQIQRWVNDNRTILQGTVPKLPDGLDDRSSNNWELLLAIAEVVGGDWPQQAQQAAVKLSAGRDDAGSVGEMLIADIRKVFDACLKLDSAFDRITSAELCAALADLEARPWAEFGRSRKPITAPQLARQLRHFGIAPDSIRVGASATTLKGYLIKAFDEVFISYPPETPLPDRNTGTTVGGVGESDDFQSGTEAECSGSKNGSKSNGEKGYSGVSDQNAEIRGAQEKKDIEADADVAPTDDGQEDF